jgi:hypothetical protein
LDTPSDPPPRLAHLFEGWRGRDHLGIALSFEAAFQLCLAKKIYDWIDHPVCRLELLSIMHLVLDELSRMEKEEAMSAAVKRQRRGQRKKKIDKPFRLEP